jgi:DtxR family transcriptional regulator, Mn-dependent transcriptional regulator
LRAIFLLSSNEHGTTVTALAHKLQLSKSTVSERLKDLASDGLVVAPPYGKVTLSPAGAKLGKKLTFKHRLVEVFLYQTLGMPKEAVHEEAEQLEHALSDEVAKRLHAFLNNPTHDPHGSKIPTL